MKTSFLVLGRLCPYGWLQAVDSDCGSGCGVGGEVSVRSGQFPRTVSSVQVCLS